MRFSDLTEQEQHDIVFADAKGEGEFSELLREPENLREWKRALVQSIEQATGEVHRRKAELLAGELSEEEYERWRYKHKAYESGLKRRLSECKDLIHETAASDYATRVSRERDELVAAIRKHRTELIDEPSEEDLQLWSHIDSYL